MVEEVIVGENKDVSNQTDLPNHIKYIKRQYLCKVLLMLSLCFMVIFSPNSPKYIYFLIGINKCIYRDVNEKVDAFA